MNIFQKILASVGLHEDYWSAALPSGTNFMPIKRGSLGGYYIDYTGKCEYDGPMVNGIPLVVFEGDKGAPKIYPITVAQMALGYYEKWLKTEDEDLRERFLHLADWFTDKQEIREKDMGVWEVHFSLPKLYRLKPPWISAMGQGQAISVLLRAHQISGDGDYLSAAARAIKAFDRNIEDGGVTTTEKDGYVFYEEYPSVPYSHVLNGFMFSLWGLYDYHLYSGDAHAMDLFDRGIDTLLRYLPRYDLGYWSRYDLYPIRVTLIASWFYHQLHIDQLKVMYLLTGRKFLNQTAIKWTNYYKNIYYKIRYLFDKIILKFYNLIIFKT